MSFLPFTRAAGRFYFLFSFLLVTGCSGLPVNGPYPYSAAYTDTGDTRFGRAHRERLLAHPDKSGILLLPDGLDAFAARVMLTAGADKTIDAQYYMVHSDLVGALFTQQLIEAADRGVRVRLLIDDMDLENRDKGLSVLARHPNIELRIFNPFSRQTLRLPQYISRIGKVTRRMHNKSFTADNQVTIVGGRNIGNEYFYADPDLNFGDLDMLAIGPVVKEVSTSFDLFWNSSFSYPVDILRPDLAGKGDLDMGRKALGEYLEDHGEGEYIAQLKNTELANSIRNDDVRFFWGTAKVYADHPDKLAGYKGIEELSLAPKLSPVFENVTKELLIISPYFVPGTEGTSTLSDLSKRGVRVRILTNSLASTDVAIVHSGYAKHRRALLRAGVELYEVNRDAKLEHQNPKKYKKRKVSLHAKSFVLDREKVFVGSLNLDPRSVTENTEIGILVQSEESAEVIGKAFESIVENASFRLELREDEDGLEFLFWHGVEGDTPRVWTHDPHTGFWKRFGVGLLGFLPLVESQL